MLVGRRPAFFPAVASKMNSAAPESKVHQNGPVPLTRTDTSKRNPLRTLTGTVYSGLAAWMAEIVQARIARSIILSSTDAHTRTQSFSHVVDSQKDVPTTVVAILSAWWAIRKSDALFCESQQCGSGLEQGVQSS
jgi:hypothetical protein